MKNSENTDIGETWFKILFGVLAILAVKSIFENDNSKIVSKEGKKSYLMKLKCRTLTKKFRFLNPKITTMRL
jgi:hypothetical protein